MTQIYTHTCIISLSNVSAHTPLAVLRCKKHMHTQTHTHTLTLTHTSIYPGQLLSQSVGSLVRGNSSGADGKAAECLAAAAEGSPSMAPAASSPPHTLAHTHTHTCYLPPFQPTLSVLPPLPVCSDWNMIVHSHQGGGGDEERQQLDIPQREHSIARWRNMRKLKTWLGENRKYDTDFIHASGINSLLW